MIKVAENINSRPFNGVIIFLAVTFNILLAFINANVLQIGSIPVIGFEIIIDILAFFTSIKAVTPLKTRWLFMICGILFLSLLETALRMSFEPKFIRDVIIIPLFFGLGLTSSRRQMINIMIIIQLVVLTFMIFEALNTELFGNVFNITSYYINTRGYDEDAFWSQETTNLYISATRSGDRFLFPSLNLHRLSSLFLEPVSLGNYCVLIFMIVSSMWNTLNVPIKLFFSVSTFLILVGCDGRFATVSILFLAFLIPVAPLLPKYANIVYLPAILLVSATVVYLLNISSAGDDFGSRTAGSILTLAQMDLADLLGFNGSYAYHVADSGISYFLISQSIVGVVGIWLFIALALPQNDRSSSIFAHQTSMYVALNLLISYSVFSLKTACILWFALGSFGAPILGKHIQRIRPKEP